MWQLDEATASELVAGYNIFEDEQLAQAGVMPLIERAFAGELIELPPIEYDPEAYEQTSGLGYGRRWLRAVFYPIIGHDAAVEEVVLIQEDITERKLAEQELRRSEARLAEAQKLARIGNVERHITDGATRWSEELFHIFGFDPEQPPPSLEEFAERVHADDRAEFDAQVVRFLDEGLPLDFDCRYQMPDGSIKYIHTRTDVVRDTDGHPERMVGTAQDVTEIKLIEERLRRSLERLDIVRKIERSILSARSLPEIAREIVDRVHRLVPCFRASLVVFDSDRSSGKVIARWGASLENLEFGSEFPIERVFGQIDDLQRGEIRVVPDLDLVDNLSPVTDRLRHAGARSYISVPLLVQGLLLGGLNIAADFPNAYGDEQVQVIGEIADALAIAMRQAQLHEEAQRHAEELEQRVRGRTAELEAANRELESFAYSVSHDLRAPLRAIDGFSLALKEDCLDHLDETGRDHLRRIQSAVQRMGSMIDALLEMSRATRGELERTEIDLTELAASVMAEIREEEPDRCVQVAIEPHLKAHADVRLVRTLLTNLLSNAWKFTAGRDPTLIEIGTVRDPTADDQNHVLFVRDSGVGFDERYADQLFAPFRRLHSESEFPGSGIGLATVERIVRRHGGRAWAQSEGEGGATFFFTLGP